jgi:hypothetical protein
MNPLLAAHGHTLHNRAEIEASTRCGCCSCMAVFDAAEVLAWSGFDMASFNDPEAASPDTGLCPRCGSEALIGDRAGYALSPDFLSRMNQAWFQKTVVRRP